MSSTRVQLGAAVGRSRTHDTRSSKKSNIILWIVQSVLAALFLFAGGFKLATPAAALAAQSHLPGAFLKFIGVCETFGALGLVLPGLTRIHRELTPLAAAGLVVIMIGAVTVTVIQGPAIGAIVPFVVGGVCALVAYRRA